MLERIPGVHGRSVQRVNFGIPGRSQGKYGSLRYITKLGLADAFDGVVLGIVPWSIFRYANSQVELRLFALIIIPGQFKYPAVQLYLHDLSSDLGERIESITSVLSLFIEVGKSFHSAPALSLSFPYSNVSGIPTIQSMRDRSRDNSLTLTIFAILFSSVTATSLHFSFSDNSSPAGIAVNAFWFASLVFSSSERKPCMPGGGLR